MSFCGSAAGGAFNHSFAQQGARVSAVQIGQHCPHSLFLCRSQRQSARAAEDSSVSERIDHMGNDEGGGIKIAAPAALMGS